MNWIAPILLLLVGFSAWAESPLIVLDSGHTPSHPGAISTCGKPEVDYNDQTVAILKKALEKNYRVLLTRLPDHEVLPSSAGDNSNELGRESGASLSRRAEIANEAGAQVLISIHHDSVDDDPANGLVAFDPAICDGHGGFRISPAFKAQNKIGYNIFVTAGQRGPRLEGATRLATLIGKRLAADGLTASNYHIPETGDCKSCFPVDINAGVWNQTLRVLRESKMPAILIETENISDPDLEKLADSKAFNALIAAAIKGGLDEYCTERPCQKP